MVWSTLVVSLRPHSNFIVSKMLRREISLLYKFSRVYYSFCYAAKTDDGIPCVSNVSIKLSQNSIFLHTSICSLRRSCLLSQL